MCVENILDGKLEVTLGTRLVEALDVGTVVMSVENFLGSVLGATLVTLLDSAVSMGTVGTSVGGVRGYELKFTLVTLESESTVVLALVRLKSVFGCEIEATFVA